jgi:hypothetical protein
MRKHFFSGRLSAALHILVFLPAALALFPSCSTEPLPDAAKGATRPESTCSVLESAVIPAEPGGRTGGLDFSAHKSSGIKFPEELYQSSNSCFRLKLRTPYTGNALIDAQIRQWKETLRNDTVKSFTQDCAAQGKSALNESGEPDYYLEINYETSSTNAGVISVLFLPSSYSGGAHPGTEAVTMNFNPLTGRLLEYMDIFGDTDGLLDFLSAHAHAVFRPALGEIWEAVPDMAGGLDAKEEYLSRFILNHQGLVLVFPPYQIAPYSEGILSCLVPLDKLLRFKPKPGIWQ